MRQAERPDEERLDRVRLLSKIVDGVLEAVAVLPYYRLAPPDFLEADVLGAQVVLARGRRRAKGREGEREAHVCLRDGVRALQCAQCMSTRRRLRAILYRRRSGGLIPEHYTFTVHGGLDPGPQQCAKKNV